jgi:hypothetical protein
MTNPKTQHDWLVRTLKQMRIDNPGLAEMFAKVIVSEREGDEWLKQIFNDIRKTKTYNSYPESLNDYDRITLTFFAYAQRLIDEKFGSSIETNFKPTQALIEYRSFAYSVATSERSRMSKDDFRFLNDLLDKADDEFKRKEAFTRDDFGIYIDFLDREEDALKRKIPTVELLILNPTTQLFCRLKFAWPLCYLSH